MKKYSIVIVAYEMKHLLKNCLESINNIKGFTRDEFEVIVSDDGSTDGTYEFIKDINRNYDLKYIYTKRSELSCRNRARNIGIKEASGEVIILLDGDVIVKENILEEFDRCYSICRDIVVTGTRIMLNEDVSYGDVVSKEVFERFHFDVNDRNALDSRYPLFNTLSYNYNAINCSWLLAYTCVVSIPRKYFDVAGYFDENIKGWGFDDSELMYRLFKLNTKVLINLKIEVLHQKHNNFRETLNEHLMEEFYENVQYFFNKHKDALEYLPENLVDYFMEDRLLELLTPKYSVKEEITIDFIDKDSIQTLNENIASLNTEGTILTINDYVEETDLDISIQLLQNHRCLIKYFPMSKRIC